MDEPVDPPRPGVLLVVDDPDLLDLLTRVFEGRGFAVATAPTTSHAIAALESERAIDVVVAAWDDTHAVGGEVYRWVLKNQLDLRSHFVFLAEVVVPEFDRIVAGRCLVVRASEVEELVRVVIAAARRNQQIALMDDADFTWIDGDRPTLLLVEDDPAQMRVVAELLTDVGFRVTAVESGNAAIAQLEQADFDVIVTDWYMADGSGADVYRWTCTLKPWLLDRLVVLTGGDVGDAAHAAQGVPVLPKGQDSAALLAILTQTARRTRQAS